MQIILGGWGEMNVCQKKNYQHTPKWPKKQQIISIFKKKKKMKLSNGINKIYFWICKDWFFSYFQRKSETLPVNINFLSVDGYVCFLGENFQCRICWCCGMLSLRMELVLIWWTTFLLECCCIYVTFVSYLYFSFPSFQCSR